jgi:hypothetical protein
MRISKIVIFITLKNTIFSLCWSNSYGNGGARGPPADCNDDEERDNDKKLCLSKCPENYKGVATKCWPVCPEGFQESVNLCMKPPSYLRIIYPFWLEEKCIKHSPTGKCDKRGAYWYAGCNEGWNHVGDLCSALCPKGTKDMGISCQKIPQERTRSELKCRPHEELLYGVCFNKCSDGFTTYQSVCSSQCPESMINCGKWLCANTNHECTDDVLKANNIFEEELVKTFPTHFMGTCELLKKFDFFESLIKNTHEICSSSHIFPDSAEEPFSFTINQRFPENSICQGNGGGEGESGDGGKGGEGESEGEGEGQSESEDLDDFINPEKAKPVWPNPNSVTAPDLIFIGDEFVHLRTYKRIGGDFEKFMEKYRGCMENYADESFTEETINGCVGFRFSRFLNDIDFEIKKILARVEDSIRNLFSVHCYDMFPDDYEKLLDCEILEKDTIDLMWQNLNFYDTTNGHKEKYLVNEGHLPLDVYKELRLGLKSIYEQTDELYNEIYDHRKISLYRLKSYINARSRVILSRKGKMMDEQKPVLVKRKIRIDESILTNDDNYRINTLPNEIIMDPYPQIFGKQKHPAVKQLLRNYPEYVQNHETKFGYDGPIIEIP